MFIVKENKQAIADMEMNREAPHIGVPFAESGYEKTFPFNKTDSAMSQIVGGYQPDPENSYAKDLIGKYPLCGE